MIETGYVYFKDIKMSQITILFTKTPFNIMSWLIRWALPRSRFALALSSHCIIDAGDYAYEAIYPEGVRWVDKVEALKGSVIVKTMVYNVPNAQAGIDWAKHQIGTKYDLKGALGLTINPSRNWDEDDAWFCYEFAAGVLKNAGLDVFKELNHVTEIALMSLKT